jgi:hypothetical protein
MFASWIGNNAVDNIDHDGTIQTIEGNTDNAVKTRDVSTVAGYGYPEYATTRT